MESRQPALCPDLCGLQGVKGGLGQVDRGEPTGAALLPAWDAGERSPHRTS